MARLAGCESAEDLACCACGGACLLGYAPVLLAVAGLAGCELFVGMRDSFLDGGEGCDRGEGLLVQLLGPLDYRVGVGQFGRQASSGFGAGPVDFCLLTITALACAPQSLFLAVEAFAAAGQQHTGLLDARPGALLHVLHGQAKTLATLAEFPLAFVGLALAFVGPDLAIVGPDLAIVGQALTLISQALTLISLALTLVGPGLALVRRTLPGSTGFPPGWLPVRFSGGWVSGTHASSMHHCHRGC